MTNLYPIALANKLTGPYQNKTVTWASLEKNLTKARLLPKAKTPLFVPAELEGSRRAIQFVKHVTLLVFDIDNKDSAHQIHSEQLLERVEQQKLKAIIYSTPSHSPMNPRYRLVIALSEPLPKKTFKNVAKRTIQLLELTAFIDRACLEPSRCYYLPSCTASNASHFESFVTSGKPLSPSDPRLCIETPNAEPVNTERLCLPALETSRHIETPDNVELVRGLLNSISANTHYESYRQVVWAVRSLGWSCTRQLLTEWSKTSPDHWTVEKASHSQETLNNLINTFDPARGVSVGTLIHLARQSGYNGQVLGQISENPFSNVSPETCEAPAVLEQLRRYSLNGDSQKLQQQVRDDVFVMQDMAILGQWTVIYAAPNCGKTLLTLWHLAESINLGAVQPDKIFYVNADDTFRGMTQKLAYAEQHGFEMLVPGHKNFQASMVLGFMSQLVDAGEAGGVVLVLDTLKKFTDLMDKRVASKFGVLARHFTAAGGTLLCLAHTNKHKDAEGKSIYSGTSDIADDCDCVYILERATTESGLVEVYSVEGRNEKARGDVTKNVGFTYSKKPGDSYEQLLSSVARQDESEIEAINLAREISADLSTDEEIIEAVIGCIEGGHTTKDRILKSVCKSTGQTQARVRDVINSRDGAIYAAGHRWTHSKGDNNAQVFAVLNPPISAHPGELE